MDKGSTDRNSLCKGLSLRPGALRQKYTFVQDMCLGLSPCTWVCSDQTTLSDSGNRTPARPVALSIHQHRLLPVK